MMPPVLVITEQGYAIATVRAESFDAFWPGSV